MTDAIAVLNAGSSSLKFSLFTARIFRPLCTGSLKGWAHGRPGGQNKQGQTLLEQSWDDSAAFDHEAALSHLLSVMPEFLQRVQVVAVGHRIVHGGGAFPRACGVDACGGGRSCRSWCP